MAEEHPKGTYTYPNTSDDPDRQNVLRNKFGIESKSELRTVEYRATQDRISEILEGDGPKGNFDAAHLKAIHGHIFQDVYEWAGHTRNESPVVDGARVEPIGGLSKGGTSFLHGARISRHQRHGKHHTLWIEKHIAAEMSLSVCFASLKTGDLSQHDTTGSRQTTSRQLLSFQSLSHGFE